MTRDMYKSISNLMGEEDYPEVWWQEREECMEKLSPHMNSIMEKAWAGLVTFWDNRGQEGDPWYPCGDATRWFEYNCTKQPGVGMDIWEPCNYASNLAWDRLMVEMCKQKSWTFLDTTVTKITQSFAILTFSSAFMHGSDTHLGARQDVMSNNLFPYVIHQAAVAHIPYDPIIHDLTYTPRDFSGEEIVDLWLDMYDNSPVEEWYEAAELFDIMPSIQRSFEGIFGYIMLLLFDLETALEIGEPFLDLLDVPPEDKTFLLEDYLPLLNNVTQDSSLSSLEKAELLESTTGTVLKLMFAFVWQEATLDLGDIILSPEANAFGAAMLPYVNSYANNLTSWDHYVEDIQAGGGYPGSGWCNDLIPHAKWHVQAAAALSDVARLMDMSLRMAQGS